MAVKIKRGVALSSLSLTPMIDVVFLLLIFFLVTTRFAEVDRESLAEMERELEVQLPTASEAKPLTMKPKELFLHVDQRGRFALGAQILNADQLVEALSLAARSNPLTQTVVVRADKRASWEAVSEAINLCHKAGIHDIRPATADK